MTIITTPITIIKYRLLGEIMGYPDLFVIMYDHLLSKGSNVTVNGLANFYVSQTEVPYWSKWLINAIKSLRKIGADDKVISTIVSFSLKFTLMYPSEDYKENIKNVINIAKEYLTRDNIKDIFISVINDNNEYNRADKLYLRKLINDM